MNPAIVAFICGPATDFVCSNAACIQTVIGVVVATFACSRQKGPRWDWDAWSMILVVWLIVVVFPTSLLVAITYGR